MTTTKAYTVTAAYSYPGTDGATTRAYPGTIIANDSYAYTRRSTAGVGTGATNVVVATAAFHYTASDGSTRHVYPGDVLPADTPALAYHGGGFTGFGGPRPDVAAIGAYARNAHA